jgi:hypothetical protein
MCYELKNIITYSIPIFALTLQEIGHYESVDRYGSSISQPNTEIFTTRIGILRSHFLNHYF